MKKYPKKGRAVEVALGISHSRYVEWMLIAVQSGEKEKGTLIEKIEWRGTHSICHQEKLGA